MGQTFRRKLQAVFGLRVRASMGFRVAQVTKSSPTEAEDARQTCRPGHVECDCGAGPLCCPGDLRRPRA